MPRLHLSWRDLSRRARDGNPPRQQLSRGMVGTWKSAFRHVLVFDRRVGDAAVVEVKSGNVLAPSSPSPYYLEARLAANSRMQ